MTRLKSIDDDLPLNAFLVGVQTPDLTETELNASLDELARLVHTLGHVVIGRLWQKRPTTSKALVLGEGKLKELARIAGAPGSAPSPDDDSDDDFEDDVDDDSYSTNEESQEEEAFVDDAFEKDAYQDEVNPEPEVPVGPKADIVVFDGELSPSQLRNLEKALGCDVIDRTGVIIEIFSRHARSRAARLQVEIARLTYLAPRIRETSGGKQDRQGGGIGGKGSGESALELDRRKIRDRISELKREFESIGREHETRRSRRSEMRTIALVGYTNAGKSSLMRKLTVGEHYVADKLFATLDTTVRPLHPASRPPILVSDTVGFIKKLPHDLVASFRSTLDEALNASLLLQVVDGSDPSFRSQVTVTDEVLNEVGATDRPRLLVLNKRDNLTPEEEASLAKEFPDAVLISTRSMDDVMRLRERVISFFESEMIDDVVDVPYTEGWAIGEIREKIKVLDESYDEFGVRFRLRARREDFERLRARLEKSEKY